MNEPFVPFAKIPRLTRAHPGLVVARQYPGGVTVTRKVLEAWKYEVKFLEISTETRRKRIRYCTDKEWAAWAKEAL